MMICETWMWDDERTPEEIERQRIRNLRQQEADLVRRLENVRWNLRIALGGADDSATIKPTDGDGNG